MKIYSRTKRKLQIAKSRLSFIEAELPKVTAIVNCGLSNCKELNDLCTERERLQAQIAGIEQELSK